MSAAAPTPALAAPRRRRLWLHALVALGTLAAIALLAIAWFVGTSGGARLALDRVAAALGEGAKVSGVEGSLAGTLRIASITVSRKDLQIRIDDVEIERAPETDWLRRLGIRRFRAGRVEVRTASTGAAASIPLSFRPPYALRVEEARVGELRIGALGGDTAKDLVLSDILVKGEGDEHAWKVDGARAATPYGNVLVRGTLATTPPFDIEANAEISGVRDAHRYRFATRLRGTLKRIEARFEGEDTAALASGTAIVQPFDKVALRALEARLQGVDPAIYASVPHARLTIEAALVPEGEQGFRGTVNAINEDPGPLDRDRLPVQGLKAKVAMTLAHGAVARAEFSDAEAGLLAGGLASGHGHWEPGRFEADLRVRDADPSAWHTAMRPARLTGTIAASVRDGSQAFVVALAEPRFQLDGRATLTSERLEVQQARVRRGTGTLTASGELAMDGRHTFRLEGRAEHFDPAAFAKTAPGDLTFTFVSHGSLGGAPEGEVKLDLAPSRFGTLAISGRAQVAGDRTRIAAADVHLAFGDGSLDAKGALGRRGDMLAVKLHAPDAAALARPFGLAVAGRIDAEGQLTGTFAAPAGHVVLDAGNLALPGIAMEKVAARVDAGAESESPLAVAIDATGVSQLGAAGARTLLAERANVAIRGTRAAHRAEVSAALSKEAELKAVLEGGLDARAPRPAWRGTIGTFALTGPSAFTLQAPASLAAAADRVELGDATIRGAWGEAHFATTRWTPALLELRGSSERFAVRNAARALRLESLPRGNLVLAASWDVRAGETLEGTVSIRHVSGDLRIGDPPQPLGLDHLDARLEAARDKVHAVFSVSGGRVGRAQGDLSATLARTEGRWSLAEGAPLQGRIDAEMPSIEWMAAWLGPDSRAAGRVDAHMVLAGTGAAPSWSGTIAASDLVVREPQTGFEVEKGEARLGFHDRTLVVEKLDASTPWHPSQEARRAMRGVTIPAAGTLSAEGSIDLAARSGALRVKASAVPVTQVSRRFVAVTGEARIEARPDGLLATGAFTADAGWIGALAEALPSVSDDVVVVRASRPAAPPRAREKIQLDVRFGFGDHLWFQGRGLDTRLAGDLRVTGDPGSGLRANGAIRTLEGAYDAYGQKLTIEYGTLTFYGALENPQLNVRALRKGLPVEAGVEVQGPVARPRVRLVSSPDVPDPEKISWLVLGRGPGEASQGDASTLVAAANAILGKGSGTTQQIAQRFGFDEVRVGRADTTSALGTLPQNTVAGRTGTASAADVVTVGKRLSKDVYVIYEQGLAAAEGSLRVTWQLTRKFSLLVRAGYLPGMDAVYRWTFD